MNTWTWVQFSLLVVGVIAFYILVWRPYWAWIERKLSATCSWSQKSIGGQMIHTDGRGTIANTRDNGTRARPHYLNAEDIVREELARVRANDPSDPFCEVVEVDPEDAVAERSLEDHIQRADAYDRANGYVHRIRVRASQDDGDVPTDYLN